MLRLKVSALLGVLSSVMVLIGLLLQYTSYSMYGKMAGIFGFGLLTLLSLYNLIAGDRAANPRLMSKKLITFKVASDVVPIFGIVLYLVTMLLGTRASVWVGIVGTSLMIIGWAMSFLKELWIERLEEENQAEPT